MKPFYLSMLLLLALVGAAFAGVTGTVTVPLPESVKQRLNFNAASQSRLAFLGTQVTEKKVNVMKAVYDYAVLGGASGATVKLRDASGGDAVIPDNAVVMKGIIDTVTAVTGDAGAEIALGVNTTTDVLGSTAIASYTGILAATPTGVAGSAFKTTGNFAVTATFAGGTVTAGKFNVFLEYYLSD